MWLDGRSGMEIERKLRVTKSQIRRILWAYAEIHRRQAQVLKWRFKFEVQDLYREIEVAVWDEAATEPPPNPAISVKAA